MGIGISFLGDGKDKKPAPWSSGIQYTYWSIFMVVATALGFAAGYWLDRRFHTKPWLSVAGALLGVAAGIRELFGLAKKIWREAERDENNANAGKVTKENTST